MRKHIVTCVYCGRQFDKNEGGYYLPKSRRYVCKRCEDKQKAEQAERNKARKAAEREAEADERERITGMRQSKAAMLVKIVVGVLFLFAAVSLAVQGNTSAAGRPSHHSGLSRSGRRQSSQSAAEHEEQ